VRKVRRAGHVATGVLAVAAVGLLWSGLHGVLTAVVVDMLLSNVGLIEGEPLPSPWLSVPIVAVGALICGGLAGLPFGIVAAEVQPSKPERERLAFILGTVLGGAFSTGLVWYVGLVTAA
jgi:hypothetical protein